MRRSTATLAVVLCGLACAALGQPEAGDGKADAVALIVNAKGAAGGLDARQAARIFLGRKQQWPEGTPIRLAVLEAPDEQACFIKAVTGRSRRQFWSHWRNLVFAGRGFMPKVFKTEGALIEYVSSEEGAVGQLGCRQPLPTAAVRRLVIQPEVQE